MPIAMSNRHNKQSPGTKYGVKALSKQDTLLCFWPRLIGFPHCFSSTPSAFQKLTFHCARSSMLCVILPFVKYGHLQARQGITLVRKPIAVKDNTVTRGAWSFRSHLQSKYEVHVRPSAPYWYRLFRTFTVLRPVGLVKVGHRGRTYERLSNISSNYSVFFNDNWKGGGYLAKRRQKKNPQLL